MNTSTTEEGSPSDPQKSLSVTEQVRRWQPPKSAHAVRVSRKKGQNLTGAFSGLLRASSRWCIVLVSAILFPSAFISHSFHEPLGLHACACHGAVAVDERCRGGLRSRPARSAEARAVPKCILERIGELCSLHIPHRSTAEPSQFGPQSRIRPVDQGGRKTIAFPHACAMANRRTERRQALCPSGGCAAAHSGR